MWSSVARGDFKCLRPLSYVLGVRHKSGPIAQGYQIRRGPDLCLTPSTQSLSLLYLGISGYCHSGSPVALVQRGVFTSSTSRPQQRVRNRGRDHQTVTDSATLQRQTQIMKQKGATSWWVAPRNQSNHLTRRDWDELDRDKGKVKYKRADSAKSTVMMAVTSTNYHCVSRFPGGRRGLPLLQIKSASVRQETAIIIAFTTQDKRSRRLSWGEITAEMDYKYSPKVVESVCPEENSMCDRTTDLVEFNGDRSTSHGNMSGRW